MLTDAAYGDEFDTVVDELTDDYVKNELQGEERERVEKYFLITTERQQKLEFASALLRRAEAERGNREKPVEVRRIAISKPTLFEQFWAFWKKQSFARLAATAASLVLSFSLLVFIIQQRNNPSSENYALVNLEISSADRATGAAARKRVAMPESGLRLILTIPEEQRDARTFSAKLIDENGAERDLTIEGQNEQTITVAVAASSLSRGTYLIQLTSVKDGSEQPVRGSYQFTVE